MGYSLLFKCLDSLEEELLRLGTDCLEKRRSLHERLFTEECCLVYRDYHVGLELFHLLSNVRST